MTDNIPLTGNDLENINKALASIELGLQQVEMAKRAGIEVGTQEKALLDTKDRLRKIKAVYFPGQ